MYRWTRTFAANEDVYRKQLLETLEIGYDMFPPTKKRGRSLLEAADFSWSGTVRQSSIGRTDSRTLRSWSRCSWSRC